MVLKISAAVILALVLGATATIAVGAARWRHAVEAREAILTSTPAQGRRIEADRLPAPVARYLKRTIPEGAPDIAVARLKQEGTFQMGEGEDGWRPFVGAQVMRATEPGFYWDATIAMAPGLGVKIRDSYVAGSAEMVGKILGVITVVDAADDADLRQGALSRYLAEAAWMPTRLVTGPGLTWRPVDETSAQATLEDRGTAVSLRFTFDAAGDLVEVYGLRQREVDGSYVETPWIGRFRDHREVEGYRIPLYGEVAWIIDGEETLYWRGTITAAEFSAPRS